MVMQLLSGRCVKALNIATAMARQNAMTTAPARTGGFCISIGSRATLRRGSGLAAILGVTPPPPRPLLTSPAPAQQRDAGIRQRGGVGFADLEDRHQRTRQLRLAVGHVENSEHRIELDVRPRPLECGRENARLGGIENAPFQFKSSHRLDGCHDGLPCLHYPAFDAAISRLKTRKPAGLSVAIRTFPCPCVPQSTPY